MSWLYLLLTLLCWTCVIASAGRSSRGSEGKGSPWWGLASSSDASNSVLDPRTSNSIPGSGLSSAAYPPLRRKQRRLVKDNPGVLAAVARGLKLAVDECQYQFKDRRWNCPTSDFLKEKNIFGKIVQIGCPETAFLYALTSAGVTHAVARACADGQSETCSCDYRNNRRPSGIDWEWGGCSDNVGFGVKFARSFIDSAERGRDLRYSMNLHNNEAGRLAVKQNMRTVCKCHGMSGSCTLKTCWRKLPVFRDVGLRLKEKFDGAAKVIPGNDGRGFIPENEVIKPPGKEDLVYVEESPNHCIYDRKTGSLGTRGRECNATSPGVDGCELLCCGRGYETIRVVERVNCKCRFQWCCQVICGTCTHKRSIHRCL